MTQRTAEPTTGGLGPWLPIVLGMLTIFGPISVDVYLPALPALRDDLDVTPALAQLTLTACLVGLAAGQLVIGPLSDRFGRRRPLLVGLGVYVVAAVLSAVSVSIEMLIVARVVQGLAGATGMVIAQASGRDRLAGPRLTRYYANIAVVVGSAALVGPLLGGQLAAFMDWRGMFLVLAGVGATIWLACFLGFSESLPHERRLAHEASIVRDMRGLVRDRGFVMPVLVVGLLTGAVIGYVSGAAFLLQGAYGLTPQQYSYVIAAGALTFVVGGIVAGQVGSRRSPRVLLPVGIGLAVAGSAATLANGILELGLPALIAAILAVTSGASLAAPAGTTLALARHPRIAGSAAAVVGVTRYALGALAAPFVGLGGGVSAVPLAIVMLVCTIGALAAMLAMPRDGDDALRQ